MRKRISIIIIFLGFFVLLLVGYKLIRSFPKTEQPQLIPDPIEQVSEPTVPFLTPLEVLVEELRGLWGRIDGSTATIPLTSALCDLLGDGRLPPEHNTTSIAYLNLIGGLADLIFVTYPSLNEANLAQEAGVELEIIPVTKDALVFLANIDNPVAAISFSQLQDIYTGKITNWKELGGIDETIVPYQRTADSGSQTLLLKLVMGEKEPMHPPGEWVAESMGALVEVVSSYDNARNAIGYSMFYYVNNMYGNSRFKLLAIDGVSPSRNTITGGEYPLGDAYYAVIRKDTPEDSQARKLINWLLTDDGQALAIRAGYIPLFPLAEVWPENTFDPIYLGDTDNSSGTGGTEIKPAAAIEEEDFSVTYYYDGRLLPKADLYTLSVKMPKNPDIANLINEQLRTWEGGFSKNKEASKQIEGFTKWFSNISDYPDYICRLQPSYEIWQDYLSISYNLHSYDGPLFKVPMLYSICFDLTSGKKVNFAKLLPADLDYSIGQVSLPTSFSEDGLREDLVEAYIKEPAAGSVITDAWLLDQTLNLYITEPDGRKLQACFWDGW